MFHIRVRIVHALETLLYAILSLKLKRPRTHTLTPPRNNAPLIPHPTIFAPSYTSSSPSPMPSRFPLVQSLSHQTCFYHL